MTSHTDGKFQNKVNGVILFCAEQHYKLSPPLAWTKKKAARVPALCDPALPWICACLISMQWPFFNSSLTHCSYEGTLSPDIYYNNWFCMKSQKLRLFRYN